MKTDTAIYPQPELALPSAGETYHDPVFGTPIQRLTDAQAEGVGFCQVRYSTVSPVNCDNSLILIEHGGEVHLHDASGQDLSPLPAVFEPLWDVVDPHRVFHCRLNGVFARDLRTGKDELLRRFSEYVETDAGGSFGLRTLGEGDIFGERLPLVGTLPDQTHHLFNFDLRTGRSTPVLDLGQVMPNSIYAIPDGGVLLVFTAIGPEWGKGIWLFSTGLTERRQLTQAGGHLDIGTDDQGFPCMIWAVNAAPSAQNPCIGAGVAKVLLAGTPPMCLLQTDWWQATHTFCPHVPGWAIVSTYTPDSSGPWTPYTNEILRVKMDGSEVQRLTHHRSRYLGGNDKYTYTPRATGSRDGTKILFNSNMGRIGSGYCDVYLIDRAEGIPVQPTEPGWNKVQFTAEEIGRHWDFGVRPDRLLNIYDVPAPGRLIPVSTWREGNEHKFRAVRAADGTEAFEFYERADNK